MSHVGTNELHFDCIRVILKFSNRGGAGWNSSAIGVSEVTSELTDKEVTAAFCLKQHTAPSVVSLLLLRGHQETSGLHHVTLMALLFVVVYFQCHCTM